MKLPELCFVFDVESVGLYGEAFAFGYVVLKDGKRFIERQGACPIGHARAGSPADAIWCRENIPELKVTTQTTAQLYADFWHTWAEWKTEGAQMFAECSWPVEAGFLLACIAVNPVHRQDRAPYPLHDIASVMLARGMNPMATYDRLPDELPKHNPLCDARQSARLLIEAFSKV